jgi:hypothetical protein
LCVACLTHLRTPARPNHSLKLTRYGMRCLAAPGTKYSILPRPSNAHLRGQLSSNVRPRKQRQCARTAFRFQDTCSGALPPHRSVQAVLLSCSFAHRLLPIAGITVARALNHVASEESPALRARYAHSAPCPDACLLRHIVSPQLVVLTSSCRQTCLGPFKQFGSNQACAALIALHRFARGLTARSRRPAPAGSVWPLQGPRSIFLTRPATAYLHGRLSSNVRPLNSSRSHLNP